MGWSFDIITPSSALFEILSLSVSSLFFLLGSYDFGLFLIPRWRMRLSGPPVPFPFYLPRFVLSVTQGFLRRQSQGVAGCVPLGGMLPNIPFLLLQSLLPLSFDTRLTIQDVRTLPPPKPPPFGDFFRFPLPRHPYRIFSLHLTSFLT